MAQTLKPEVHARILGAAAEVFAAEGFQRATMAAIARRAELSTGNVYRYVPGKVELFDEVVGEPFARRFLELLDARVASLASLQDLRSLDADARHRQVELLDFWVAHRLQVVILLDRAAGTPLEDFGDRFVHRLVDHAASTMPPLSAIQRFVLERIFQGTRLALVAILEQHTSEADVRAAFASFWSYQLAGLAGFRQEVSP